MKIEFVNPYPMKWQACFDKAFYDCERTWVEKASLNGILPEHRIFMWCDDSTLQFMTSSLAYASKNHVFIRRFEYFSDIIDQMDWSRVHTVFCVNDYLAQGVEQRTGRTPYVVYNGVDLDAWTYRDRYPGKNVAMVGFVNSRKNFPLAMEIMQLLPRAYTLHVIGDIHSPETIVYMKESAESNNLKVKVYESDKDIDRWLEDKDCLLCTSISEGCPNNVIEAMAKGIKPIVHCWPGAREQFGPYVFRTAQEAANMIMAQEYDSASYRGRVEKMFSGKNYFKIREVVLG